MNKYLLSYYGIPKHVSEEDAKKGKEEWFAWATEFGSAIVEPGLPVKTGKSVSMSGVSNSDKEFTGYTIVQAKDIEAAIEMARKNPYLKSKGCTIDVAEVVQMDM